MADDYIKVKTFGKSNENGFKLVVSIVNNINFFRGMEIAELSVATTDERTFFPITGTKTDLNFTVELIDDSVNKGFSIDNIGNETPLSKVSTAEQINFLLEQMMPAGLGTVHEVYVDWLGKTYSGIMSVRGVATGDEFFNRVVFDVTLKTGGNILGL